MPTTNIQVMKPNVGNQTVPWVNNPWYNTPPHWITQCQDNRKVALYIVHGLVIDAVYSSIPCNSSTWPAGGVPGTGGVFTTEPTPHVVVLDKTKWELVKEKMSFYELSNLNAETVPSNALIMDISLVKNEEKISLVHNYIVGKEKYTVITPLIVENDMLKIQGENILINSTENKVSFSKTNASKKHDYVGHVTLIR
jgi:hypothetical protein